VINKNFNSVIKDTFGGSSIGRIFSNTSSNRAALCHVMPSLRSHFNFPSSAATSALEWDKASMT